FLTILGLVLANAQASAEAAVSSSAVIETLISEIRQLRSDLQNATATIQRVQIVMYRLQSEANVLDRATQRLHQAPPACHDMESSRTMLTSQIEMAQANHGAAQTSPDREGAEHWLSNLRSSLESLPQKEQQCQLERAEAENLLRMEEAKMDDLQRQLDKLDK